MLDFIEKLGVDFLNCFFQFIIALCAVIAISITIQQISSKTKINLKIQSKFRLNIIEHNKKIVELEIKMLNMGMAPVYISDCGILVCRNKKKKQPVSISEEYICLQPGQSKVVSGEYHGDIIDKNACLHDKVFMYAQCQRGKIYYNKKNVIKYDEFLHQYHKYKTSADKGNSEINT